MRELQFQSQQSKGNQLVIDYPLLQAILDDSTEAIFLLDAESFTILDCNKKALTFFQAEKKEELVNFQCFKLYNSEPVRFSKELVMHEIHEGASFSHELAFKTLKGYVFWGKMTSRLLPMEGNNIVILRISKVIDYIKAEETLATLINRTSKVTGRQFFKELTRLLAQTFSTRYVLIGKVTGTEKNQIETVQFWSGDAEAENFIFDFKNGPVENVIKGYISFYPQKLTELFPKDTFISSMGIESFMGSPIYNAKDRPSGVLVIMDDKPMQEVPNARYLLSVLSSRTGAEFERIESEELMREKTIELAKAYEVNNKMLRILANDILDPFTLNSQLLNRTADSTSNNRLLAKDHSLDNSVKLQNLIEWSKWQIGKLIYSPACTSLHKIIKENLRLFQPLIDNMSISVNNSVKEEVQVQADEEMLNTIVRNLISNAVKFNVVNGRIDITVKITDEKVTLYISDTGAGFSFNEIKDIVEKRDTQNIDIYSDKNAGLGLLLSYAFVEKNEGEIHILKNKPAGSIVAVSLNIAK
jgi:signal transduction histidine kinase